MHTCDLLVVLLADDQVVVNSLNDLLNRLQRRSQGSQSVDFLAVSQTKHSSQYFFMRVVFVQVRHCHSRFDVVTGCPRPSCLLNRRPGAGQPPKSN